LRSEFDEQYASNSPGAVLESDIIKSLFENGFKEYDMGGSADEYKKHWTTGIREHANILVFNKGLYPKLMSFLEGTIIPYIKRRELFQRLKKAQNQQYGIGSRHYRVCSVRLFTFEKYQKHSNNIEQKLKRKEVRDIIEGANLNNNGTYGKGIRNI